MTEQIDGREWEPRRLELGDIDPARSRHMWTRSVVHLTDELLIVGQWDGTVTAYRRDPFECQWSLTHPDHPVGITALETDTGEVVVIAGRGESGTILAVDAESGEQCWAYETTQDVGASTADRLFELPYVVALDWNPEQKTIYAAARRYERDGERRRWHSCVYAFDANGEVHWRYETDASPIALDSSADGELLAVGYNRCMGTHDTGLVVLEAETGDLAWTWDPGTEGDRRVGDVAFDGETVAVASHGDKRGYLLDPRGAERWRVNLAVETQVGEETLYAYPTHVHAADGRVAFVTGNTYARERRETEGRHPNEHRIAAFDADGDALWDHAVRGFVHDLATDGETILAPCAQNFRVRDPATHALRRFDLETGPTGSVSLEGIATAAAIDGDAIAAIEEPVVYHDEGTVRGAYACLVSPSF